MEQYTSEQALNGIFSILSTMMEQNEQARQNQGQSGGLISSLQNGGAASAPSQGGGVGQQIEALAKGIQSIKDNDINEDDIKTVASLISTLGNEISELEFDEVNIQSVKSIAQALMTFGSISDSIIENIESLGNVLTKSRVDNILYFSKAFDVILENIEKNTVLLAGLFNALGGIDDKMRDQIVALGNALSAELGLNIYSFAAAINGDVGDAVQNSVNVIAVINTLGRVDLESLKAIRTIGNILDKDLALDIVEFMTALQITKEQQDASKIVAETIHSLAQFKVEDIENIKHLKEIDPSIADNLIELINKLDIRKNSSIDEAELKKSVAALTSFLSSVQGILNQNVGFFGTLFMPIKGRLIGRGIANFMRAIMKAIPEKEIKVEMKGVAEIMNVLMKFADKDSKYSINRLKKIMTEKNGLEIGAFFKGILDAMPDKKKTDGVLKPCADIISLFSDFGFGKYVKLRMLMNEKNGRKLGAFFSALLDEIPTKKVDLKPISKFLKELASIGVVGALSIKILGEVLTEKAGKNINMFVKNLIKGFDKNTLNKVDTFADAVKKLSIATLILVGTAVLMAGALALFGLGTMIESVLMVTALAGGMLFIMKSVAAKAKDIDKGGKVMLHLAAAIGLLVLDVAMFAYISEQMALVDWESIGKTAVIFGTLVLAMGVGMYLGKTWEGNGKSILLAMAGMSLMMLSATFAIRQLVEIAVFSSMGDIALGIGMLLVTTGFMVGMVMLLNRIKSKDITYAVGALVGMTMVTLGIALVLDYIVRVVRVNDAKDLWLGAGLLMGALGVMVGLVSMLNKFVKSKDVLWGIAALAALTVIVATVGFIISALMVPLGQSDVIGSAALGAGLVLLTTAALILELKLLNTVGSKELLWGVVALAGMSFITLGVSLIVKELFIPIGQVWDQAAAGGLVVLSTIGIMTAMVFGIAKLMKHTDKRRLGEAALVIAGCATLIYVCTLATMKFVELAKTIQDSGLSGGDLLATGALVVGLIGVFGGIAYGVGELLKKGGRNAEKNLLMGGIVIAGISAIIAAVSGATLLFADVAEKVHKLTVNDVVATGLIMGALLTAFGAIAVGLGALMDTGIGAAVLASGLAAVAGIAGGIALMSVASMEFADVASTLARYDENELIKGGEIMAAVIGSFGVVMSAVGLLVPFIALGTVSLTAINSMMESTIKTVRDFSNGMILISKLNNNQEFKKGSPLYTGFTIIEDIINRFYDLMDSISVGVLVDEYLMKSMISTMNGVLDVTKKFASILKYTNENISATDITKFFSIVVGKGKDDTNSMIGVLSYSIEEMKSLSGGVIASFLGFGTAGSLKDSLKAADMILNTISKFIDVIAKVSRLTYISGYDDNGKPIFDRISPDDFGKAANVVTKEFKYFVDELVSGFDKLSFTAVIFTELVGRCMNPVIDTCGKFIKVIRDLATSTYVVGYDDKGNPELARLEMEDFANAANVVTSSFSKFVTTLSKDFENISLSTIIAVKYIGKSMQPVIAAVGGFVDAIIKAASGTYTITSEDGKQQTMRITDDMLSSAANTITTYFTKFMKALTENAKDMSIWSTVVLNAMGEGVGSLMNGLSGFVDAIIKMASGTITLKVGDKQYVRKITNREMQNAALNVTRYFNVFLVNLGKSAEKLSYKGANVIEQLGKGITPVMNSVGQFVNAILTVAAGTVTYTDKNGKQIIEKLTMNRMNMAAHNIAVYFHNFLASLLKVINTPAFINSGAKAMELLAEAVEPVMKSVVDFSNMLINFSKPQGTIKVNGKNVPFRLDSRTISSTAVRIANAYILFIKTLINKMEADADFKKRVKNASSYITDVSKVATQASKGAASLTNLMNKLKDVKGLKLAADGSKDSLTMQLVNSLIHLSNGIVEGSTNYKFAKDDFTTCAAMTKQAHTVASNLASILKTLDGIKQLSVSDLLTTQFVTAIEILGKTRTDMQSLSRTMLFVRQTNQIAKELVRLEKIMNNSEMTKACLKFIKDIEILTQDGVVSKVDNSRKALNVFGRDLTKFNVVVEKTTKTTIKFTNNMKKATDALSELDEAILTREKKRNESLHTFSKLIDNMTTSVKNLKSQIESLDENKILQNFESISAMLELAKQQGESIVNGTNNGQNNSNKQVSVVGTNGQNGGANNGRAVRGGNSTIVNGNMSGKQVVTFIFSNTRFNGTMEVGQF